MQAEESDPRRRHLTGDPEIHSRAPTCQNLDIPRMPTNSNACPTIREDAIECSGVPENRVIFTKAWVDVDPVRVDGVKDASAVERWQEQAFEVDTDFYNRLHIPERDEPGEATAALQNAARQGQGGSVGSQPVDSKKNSEGRSHGVEQIKQGIMEYVATLLKPLYKTNKLDRDGYKAVMKKGVTKVEHYFMCMFVFLFLLFLFVHSGDMKDWATSNVVNLGFACIVSFS